PPRHRSRLLPCSRHLYHCFHLQPYELSLHCPRQPPCPPLFPYTTLFRSIRLWSPHSRLRWTLRCCRYSSWPGRATASSCTSPRAAESTRVAASPAWTPARLFTPLRACYCRTCDCKKDRDLCRKAIASPTRGAQADPYRPTVKCTCNSPSVPTDGSRPAHCACAT